MATDDEPNIDWRALMRKALEECRNGEPRAVPGAQLREAVARLASAEGINLTRYLVSRKLAFSTFLEAQSDLILMRRAGTDMLVASSLDEFPPPGTSPKGPAGGYIRQDFYEALTQFVGGMTYSYDPENDQVLNYADRGPSASSGSLIPLPPASVEDEIACRRDFARQQNSEALIAALASQQGALTQFRSRVKELGLQAEWHRFRYEALGHKLLEWATSKQVEVRQNWFERDLSPRTDRPGHAQLMRSLMEHMTEQELLDTRVPLRAVYNLLNRPPGRQ